MPQPQQYKNYRSSTSNGHSDEIAGRSSNGVVGPMTNGSHQQSDLRHRYAPGNSAPPLPLRRFPVAAAPVAPVKRNRNGIQVLANSLMEVIQFCMHCKEDTLHRMSRGNYLRCLKCEKYWRRQPKGAAVGMEEDGRL